MANREAIYPKAGYIFQHKENADSFARVIYLGEGVSIDEYREITEEEYGTIQAEQEERAKLERGGMIDENI